MSASLPRNLAPLLLRTISVLRTAIAVTLLAIQLGVITHKASAQTTSRTQVANPAIIEWRRAVSLRISRQARLLGRLSERGETLIGIRVDRSGRSVESKVLRSSGNTELDGAFLAVVRTATPFPPLPAAYTGSTVSFTIPMASRIRKGDFHGMKALRPFPRDF